MIKKILWFLLIFVVLYILAIFKAPVLADSIEDLLKINWFNQTVRDFKTSLDNIYTNLPSKEQVIDTYNKTLSWANELKEKAWSWTKQLKESIDNVRLSISWSVDKYEWIKNDIIETKQKMDQTVDTIKSTSEAIGEFWENIKNTSSWILENNPN